MAMSRIMSQSLPRSSSALIRYRSTKPNHAHLIELDLDAASPSQSDSSGSPGITKLEEAIHNIIVRRAAPDWLPFRPGYSYWVPPRSSSRRNHPAGGVIEAVEKFTSDATRSSRSHHEMLSEDEQMSLTSAKGWPSSAFFIQGTSPQHPIQVMELADTSSLKDELG